MEFNLHQLAMPLKGDPLHVQLMRDLLATYLVIDWDEHHNEACKFETVVMDVAGFLYWRLDNR